MGQPYISQPLILPMKLSKFYYRMVPMLKSKTIWAEHLLVSKSYLLEGGSEKSTLMCLSIGTPNNNKFSICPKWKIQYFQVSQNLGSVQPHYIIIMCLNVWTPKNH